MIEKYLKEYNEYKTKIRLLEIEIDDSISLGSRSDDPLPGRVSARTNTSVVERQAKHIDELQNEIRQLKKLVNKIDTVLDTLDVEAKELIKLRYVDEIPVLDISIRYSITTQAVYERFKVIFKSLEKYCNYILN